jgi:hypothetical protein
VHIARYTQKGKEDSQSCQPIIAYAIHVPNLSITDAIGIRFNMISAESNIS